MSSWALWFPKAAAQPWKEKLWAAAGTGIASVWELLLGEIRPPKSQAVLFPALLPISPVVLVMIPA